VAYSPLAGALSWLASALARGSGDVVGGLAACRVPQFQVVALAALSGLAVLVPVGILRGEAVPSAGSILWALGAGLCGAIGVASLYAGLARGPAALVAPTATVVGVGLPGHFVAKAVDGPDAILFDPFHGGRLLTVEECETLVERVTGEAFRATPASLAAVPLAVLVRRMLNNLKAIYLQSRDLRRAVCVMERLRQLDPADVEQRKDLGAALCEAGQPGKAIAHLEAYLRGQPHAGDHDTVRRLLNRARGEVARWN